jgi:hypothetical protein
MSANQTTLSTASAASNGSSNLFSVISCHLYSSRIVMLKFSTNQARESSAETRCFIPTLLFERPGHRVSRRRRAKSKVGMKHRVSADESRAWFIENFNITILEE